MGLSMSRKAYSATMRFVSKHRIASTAPRVRAQTAYRTPKEGGPCAEGCFSLGGQLPGRNGIASSGRQASPTGAFRPKD